MLLGLVGVGTGAWWTVHELRSAQPSYVLPITVGTTGVLMFGLYAIEKARTGVRREHVGQTELDVEQGHEPCGTKTPASEVAVKLVDSEHQAVTLVRTDAMGQAAIPEDEVSYMDAPVDVYVNDIFVGRNSAAVARGHAAAAKVREKLEREEQLAREKRAREELRIAQEQLKARVQRAASFRKSVKVGDASHCSLVIEIKSPVVKIQTMVGERWLKREQLYAEGDAPCRFFNSVYQDP